MKGATRPPVHLVLAPSPCPFERLYSFTPRGFPPCEGGPGSGASCVGCRPSLFSTVLRQLLPKLRLNHSWLFRIRPVCVHYGVSTQEGLPLHAVPHTVSNLLPYRASQHSKAIVLCGVPSEPIQYSAEAAAPEVAIESQLALPHQACVCSLWCQYARGLAAACCATHGLKLTSIPRQPA